MAVSWVYAAVPRRMAGGDEACETVIGTLSALPPPNKDGTASTSDTLSLGRHDGADALLETAETTVANAHSILPLL